MLQVYLVRHGETEWNAARRIQGQSDSPLTEKGLSGPSGGGACAQRRHHSRYHQ